MTLVDLTFPSITDIFEALRIEASRLNVDQDTHTRTSLVAAPKLDSIFVVGFF